MATVTTDKVVKLRELPVTINVTKLAEGLLGLFTDEERTVLRFGMLPAKKMEALESQLLDKFEGLGRHPRDVWPLSLIATAVYPDTARVSSVNGEVTEWDIRKLTAEAVHEITLAIYAIGDLIV